MTTLQALFLGVLQGITELLPISSSGHLALAERWLHVSIPQGMMGFDVLLHVGSLGALLLCYAPAWVRILRSPFVADRTGMRLLGLLIVATIPAAVAGVLFGDALDAMRSSFALGSGFIISGAVLLIAERMPAGRTASSLRLWEVIAIGCAQAIALAPSVSRSGMTLAAGRSRSLRRSEAVDFAFLMAVPAIAGAALLTAVNVAEGTAALPPPSASAAGLLASFGVSICAILGLRAFVRRASTAWFALYLIPLGLFLLAR